MASATISFTLEEADFAGIIEMAGYGVGYWANYMESVRNDEGVCTGCHFTEAETGNKFFITREMVEKAVLDLHLTAPLNDYYQSAFAQLVVRNCSGDVGSDIADAIIQQACFSEVIYG